MPAPFLVLLVNADDQFHSFKLDTYLHNTYLLCRKQIKHSKKYRLDILFFQILWKSRCDILVIFPSHLK